MDKLKRRIIIGAFVILSVLFLCSLGLAIYFYQSSSNDECNEENGLLDLEESKKISSLNVEVKGAVKKPGVYKVNEENIINDVIILAEGLTKNAYTDNINLSYKVSDGLVIYIFTKDEYNKKTKQSTSTKKKTTTTTKTPTCESNGPVIDTCIENKESIITPGEEKEVVENTSGNSSEGNQNGIININTASQKELETLPGIGASKAQAIIEYRNSVGKFNSPDEITKVSGIGIKTYEKFKSRIKV